MDVCIGYDCNICCESFLMNGPSPLDANIRFSYDIDDIDGWTGGWVSEWVGGWVSVSVGEWVGGWVEANVFFFRTLNHVELLYWQHRHRWSVCCAESWPKTPLFMHLFIISLFMHYFISTTPSSILSINRHRCCVIYISQGLNLGPSVEQPLEPAHPVLQCYQHWGKPAVCGR